VEEATTMVMVGRRGGRWWEEEEGFDESKWTCNLLIHFSSTDRFIDMSQYIQLSKAEYAI
jgi:hypothetical protein